MLLRFRVAASALGVLFAANSAYSQSLATTQQPAYTFQAGTRVVLTDVVVTDRSGNPVSGIPQSAFQIYDNSKPQTIASFEEHTTTPVDSLPRVSTAPGAYSNAFLAHLPPVLNVIVLDTTNLEIVDQMYLSYQLKRFIEALPAGDPIAIYWHTGPASFLLQNFTSDHALLLAAVHKALPHFPPTGREYYSDFATLHKIVFDFGQYPGRKNILWFSGGSTMYLNFDPTNVPDTAGWRRVYDELETSRIAVYPIDARGLVAGYIRTPYGFWAQHALMNEIADTTGGHSYYNNNGLGHTAQRWLDGSGDFYTLTYSPRDFRIDNKWHKVKVKLTGYYAHYTLSYRRGYFADNSSNETPGQKPRPRTLLARNGTTSQVPDLHSIPLVFQARIIPAAEAHAAIAAVAEAAPKKGTIPYAIHYTVPIKELTSVMVDGKPEMRFNVAAFSFDKNGEVITRLGTTVSFNVSPAKLSDAAPFDYPFDQRINLRKGQNYIYLAIWDAHTGRLGTLEIPFEAAKPK